MTKSPNRRSPDRRQRLPRSCKIFPMYKEIRTSVISKFLSKEIFLIHKTNGGQNGYTMSKVINPELFITFLSVLSARYQDNPYCDEHKDTSYSFHLRNKLQINSSSVAETLLSVSSCDKTLVSMHCYHNQRQCMIQGTPNSIEIFLSDHIVPLFDLVMTIHKMRQNSGSLVSVTDLSFDRRVLCLICRESAEIQLALRLNSNLSPSQQGTADDPTTPTHLTPSIYNQITIKDSFIGNHLHNPIKEHPAEDTTIAEDTSTEDTTIYNNSDDSTMIQCGQGSPVSSDHSNGDSDPNLTWSQSPVGFPTSRKAAYTRTHSTAKQTPCTPVNTTSSNSSLSVRLDRLESILTDLVNKVNTLENENALLKSEIDVMKNTKPPVTSTPANSARKTKNKNKTNNHSNSSLVTDPNSTFPHCTDQGGSQCENSTHLIEPAPPVTLATVKSSLNKAADIIRQETQGEQSQLSARNTPDPRGLYSAVAIKGHNNAVNRIRFPNELGEIDLTLRPSVPTTCSHPALAQPSITILGDSNLFCMKNVLTNALPQVSVCAQSGATVSSIHDTVIRSDPCDILVLEIGINDADQLDHPELARGDIQALISTAKLKAGTVVLVPPPPNTKSTTRMKQSSAKMEEIILEESRAAEVICIKVSSLFPKSANGYLFKDKLHVTRLGAGHYAKLILDKLKESFPDLDVKNICVRCHLSGHCDPDSKCEMSPRNRIADSPHPHREHVNRTARPPPLMSFTTYPPHPREHRPINNSPYMPPQQYRYKQPAYYTAYPYHEQQDRHRHQRSYPNQEQSGTYWGWF